MEKLKSGYYDIKVNGVYHIAYYDSFFGFFRGFQGLQIEDYERSDCDYDLREYWYSEIGLAHYITNCIEFIKFQRVIYPHILLIHRNNSDFIIKDSSKFDYLVHRRATPNINF